MAHLFDSNIFLRLAEKNSPHRQIALSAIRKLHSRHEVIYYTPQVIAEFWNVCTRPSNARGGFGLSVEQTQRKINLIQKHFTLLPDNLASFTEWQKLVLDFQVKGVQVHDAKLVASMLAYNIPNLVTFNATDFRRFSMIAVISPQDI